MPNTATALNLAKSHIALTRNLPCPNMYVSMMEGEFRDWAFNEERAPLFRGKWRDEVFKKTSDQPLDLEIGTGNGFYFAHHAQTYPQRSLVGIELKYKPLVQSIRRALRFGCENARIMRYDAFDIEHLFTKNELNNVYVHFPDPWEKKRHWKNRLISERFLEVAFSLQREGSFLEFKTDSMDYFDWAMPIIEKSQYRIERHTRDLHQSEWKSENFITQFESLFLRQKLPIYYTLLRRQ